MIALENKQSNQNDSNNNNKEIYNKVKECP